MYQKPNSRYQDILFTASLCWRSESGKGLLDGPLCQQLVNRALQSCQATGPNMSPIETVANTNCVYLAHSITLKA